MPLSSGVYHSRKLRQRLLNYYGRVCCHCGFSDERALQLDHVNGGGAEEQARIGTNGIYRKALKAPVGEYQLLCANCNWIKRCKKKELPYGGGDKPLVL